MEIDRLLGLEADRGIELLVSSKIRYHISETVSPKRDESLSEKRIIRVKQLDNRIDLTIGYF